MKRFIIISILWVSIQVYAKPHLGPPSIQLRTNLANIVTAKLVSISKDYTLEFRLISDLHNTYEDTISLASNTLISGRLRIGQTYIVAFNKHIIDHYSKNVSLREGPAIMANIPGAEPAIFAEDENIKKMLAYKLDDSITSPESMLKIIFDGLRNEDSYIRNFFITEIITRPKLWKKLNTQQYQQIFTLLDDNNTSLISKDFILLHAGFPQSIINSDAYYSYLINPLKYMPVELNYASNQASYIRTCLQKITPIIKKSDSKIIARWLKSNNTAVIENAAKLLHKVDHRQEIKLIKQLSLETMLSKNAQQTLKKLLNHQF